MRKRVDWNRMVPPGLDGERTWNYFKWGFICAAALALFGFFNYAVDVAEYHYELERVGFERAAASIRSLPEYLDGIWLGFQLFVFAMVPLTIWHYAYHWSGAKPIYLMRRLPSRWELHRRCLTMPLLGLGGCAVLAALIVALYCVIYRLFTPKEIYTPGQLWLWLGL